MSPEHTGNRGQRSCRGQRSKVTILKVLQLGQVQGRKKFAYLNEANPTPTRSHLQSLLYKLYAAFTDENLDIMNYYYISCYVFYYFIHYRRHFDAILTYIFIWFGFDFGLVFSLGKTVDLRIFIRLAFKK